MNYKAWQACVREFDRRLSVREREVGRILEQDDLTEALERAEAWKNRFRERLLRRSALRGGSYEGKLTGCAEYDGYSIERYELQKEGCPPLAVNVYVPGNQEKSQDRDQSQNADQSREREIRHPALLVTTGHWADSMLLADTQIMCANFALNGVVTAVFDPVCQGRRRMFSKEENRELFPGLPDDLCLCSAHDLLGNMAYFLQEDLMAMFVRDALAVLDLLCSRDDVDTDRVGCTGQSGGGTQALYVTACDDRVRYCAFVQCVSKMHDVLPGGIGDAEQSMAGISENAAADYADQIWACFPRPILFSGALEDSFPYVGARAAADEAASLYRRAGREEDFEVCFVPGGHRNGPQSRLATYRFFLKRMGLSFGGTEQPVGLIGEDTFRQTDTFTESLRQTPASYEYLERIRQLIRIRPVSRTDKKKALRELIYRTVMPEEMHGSWQLLPALKAGADRLAVVVGDAPQAPREDEDILAVRLFADAGPKQTAGYDINTCIAYAALVLGSPVCAGRVRDILDGVEEACRQKKYAGIRICAAPHLAVPTLLAAFISEQPMEPEDGLCAPDFEELFKEPGYRMYEQDILPGLLQIGDMRDFCQGDTNALPD